MSWAAHQFEGYVLQRHFGERYTVSYLAIVAGDAAPDFFAKAWVYGVTINGHHYGSSDPATFHRSWPGAGFTHSLAFGVLLAALLWWAARRRRWAVPWALGIVIGQWAHAITDINDSKGTMLLFPLTKHNFSIGTWAYGAQVGKYHDAAAYFSSFGFVMDVTWFLVVVLLMRHVLTRRYFEGVVRPSDPAAWTWLSRRLPEEALVALYRSMFVYGVARVIAWTTYAHAIAHFRWDLHWGGPNWLAKVSPSTQTWPWLIAGIVGVTAVLGAFRQLALQPHRRSVPAHSVPAMPSMTERASRGQSVTMPSNPVATAEAMPPRLWIQQ
jgi:membrane-bound metal-dependent hydrolase YbcI (DUF457 family)